MSITWTLVGILAPLLLFVFALAITAPQRPGTAPTEIERDNAGKIVKAHPFVRFVAGFAFGAVIVSVSIFLHSGGRLSTHLGFTVFSVGLAGLLGGLASVRGGRLERFFDRFFSGGF